MASHDSLEILEPPERPGPRPEVGYARVAAGIRAMIVADQVRPGTWLRMAALAERFDVSVQPVREALQLLQGEGLVELHPNRGAQVRGLDRGRLVHIYEIRAALESFMARRFAEDASGRDIRALERLQAAHDAALDAANLPEALRVNKDFHALINGRGGNQEGLELIRRYYDLSASVRARSGYSAVYPARVRTEHHELLDAIRRHDGSAAADVGARHVMHTLDEILGWLNERNPGGTDAP